MYGYIRCTGMIHKLEGTSFTVKTSLSVFTVVFPFSD